MRTVQIVEVKVQDDGSNIETTGLLSFSFHTDEQLQLFLDIVQLGVDAAMRAHATNDGGNS